jgi:hypothetical protein
MWDIVPKNDNFYKSCYLQIRCENYIVSKGIHANLYNVMTNFRCDKVKIINLMKGELSNELKRLIITKLEIFIKNYNSTSLYLHPEDTSFLIPSRENTFMWLNNNMCCGSINMGINAIWKPVYKLENDYIKQNKNKDWYYDYEFNKLPWKSRNLDCIKINN